MTERKQYAFEDWKRGKIKKDFEGQAIDGFDYSKVQNIGWLPTELYEQGFMNVEEYRKIDEAQKQTFDKGVEQNVRVSFKFFKERLKSAYKPRELLVNEIESLEASINKVPRDIMNRVYEGDWSRINIDYSKHMALNDPRFINADGRMHFSDQIQIRNRLGQLETIDIGHNQKKSHNHVLDVTVAIRYLDKLQELFNEKYADRSDLREGLTRQEIFDKVKRFKKDGMSVVKMFENIKKWLLDDLGFTEEEIKERYNFSLKDPDSFNRFVNRNTSYNK